MTRNGNPTSKIVLPGVAEALRDTKILVGSCVSSLSAGDLGHFGPGSVSWRIFSHASYGASGIAAVLMQALHPVAMAGVDQHSAFRSDAWRRAHMTADYVFAITFSSRAVADAAADKVRRIHRRVAGIDPVTGRAYRADDPDLLLWIHSVHAEYALRGYETLARPLAPEDQDRFVAEQVTAARLVGLEPSLVPATRAELRRFIETREELRLTEPAAEFAAMLLRARMPITMRGFWALHIAAAARLLPEWALSAYRWPDRLPRGRLATRAMRLAFNSMNLAYLLFRPVRQARARLKWAEAVAARRDGAAR